MFCKKCHHKLIGTGQSQCPECGHRYHADDPKTYDRYALDKTTVRALKLTLLFDRWYVFLACFALTAYAYYDMDGMPWYVRGSLALSGPIWLLLAIKSMVVKSGIPELLKAAEESEEAFIGIKKQLPWWRR